MKTMLSVCLLAAACATPAFASDTCRGVITIDTVYQRQVSQGKFEYFAQVRNATNKTIRFRAQFGGFPREVSLFTPSLNMTLSAHQNQNLRFASGSYNQINDGNVKKLYDSGSHSGPFVLISACQQ